VANSPFIIFTLPKGWTFINDYTTKTRYFLNNLEIYFPNIVQSELNELVYLYITQDLVINQDHTIIIRNVKS